MLLKMKTMWNASLGEVFALKAWGFEFKYPTPTHMLGLIMSVMACSSRSLEEAKNLLDNLTSRLLLQLETLVQNVRLSHINKYNCHQHLSTYIPTDIHVNAPTTHTHIHTSTHTETHTWAHTQRQKQTHIPTQHVNTKMYTHCSHIH